MELILNYKDALIGGGMIGLAATLLFLLQGRIMGVSGIIGSLLSFSKLNHSWRLSFLTGLGIGGVCYTITHPLTMKLHSNPWIYILGGLFVGFGSLMANGCTSGHGICGLSRGSPRSVVALLFFMISGIITVIFLRKFF